MVHHLKYSPLPLIPHFSPAANLGKHLSGGSPQTGPAVAENSSTSSVAGQGTDINFPLFHTVCLWDQAWSEAAAKPRSYPQTSAGSRGPWVSTLSIPSPLWGPAPPALADFCVSDSGWQRAGSEWKQSWHPSCVRRANYTEVGSGPRGPLLRGRMPCRHRERAALQRKWGNSST